MKRIQTPERPNWRKKADEYGFKFHTLYGEPYWDESAYYRFSLEQIEEELEAPTQELHEMCLQVVDRVVDDERLMRQFQIPEAYWDVVRQSWLNKDSSVYSRLDFVYNGKQPAKLLENNADTPTSLYETGFWQWLWLEDKIASGELPPDTDQFNSLQEKLIERFVTIHASRQGETLYFSCCKDTDEDRGTVQYMQDCAEEAGIACRFIYVEDIGHGEEGSFTDLNNQVIEWMFKLYPWEFMFREEYAPVLLTAKTAFIEPLWKSILSNKALLPMLWKMAPNHPHLLPAYFAEDVDKASLTHYVKKPLFAREGSNISIIKDGVTVEYGEGPYGEEGYIYQAYYPLPVFDRQHTLIGSWLVDDQPAGISVREDSGPITKNSSRFLPHIIRSV